MEVIRLPMQGKRSNILDLATIIARAATISDFSTRAAMLDELVGQVSAGREPDVSTVVEKAIALARERNDAGFLAAVLWLAGVSYLRIYAHAEAGAALDEAVARAVEAGDTLLQARVLDAAAETAFRLHDYSKTLLLAQRALAIWEDAADLVRQANTLTLIGATLMQMSRYQEAFERLYAALELYKQLGKPHLSGRALNYVAIMHEELGDFEQAIRCYTRSLEMIRMNGDADMEGRVLANLGDAYVTMRENSLASSCLTRAVEVLRPLGAHSLYGWCLLALARLHMNCGEDEQAGEVLEQALAAAEKGGAKRTLAETLAGIGILRAKLGDYVQAQQYLYRALSLAEEAQVNREIYKINHALADVHEQFGNFERALEHHKQFQRTRSAVYDELAKAKISSLTSQFELEKSRQAQEISHLKNVELAHAYEELKELHLRLEEQTRELQEMSIRDDLTGVHNRRYLDQRLAEEFARARRYRSALTVAMWDADRFKEINDRLSHAVGDAVLKRLAEVVGQRIRQSDILVRYGGEEFVIVFLETRRTEALIAAEEIRAAVEHHDWSQIHPELQVTISMGLSDDLSVTAWDELLAKADAKLYEAKVSGRNRVCS